MRVLLIKPETVGVFSYTNLVDHEPLELEYIYTLLKNNGHTPFIYDKRHDYTPLISKIKKISPDVVCITGYITQEKLIIKFIRLIKRFNPQISVIVGGSHAEINYRNFFDSQADYIYHLSGLDCFLQLINYIDNPSSCLSDIPGICYKEGYEWKVTKKIHQTPDDLPIVNRQYFNENKNRYRYLIFHPLALVKNSYSCAHSCSFCYCTNLNSGIYACRNAESLVEEINLIDAPNIHITDDNFLTNKHYLKQFIALVKEKRIKKKYLIYGRADFIAENEELMKELKEIGLSLVMVGLEATSNKELNSYNKNATIEHNESCVRVLNELGIICAGLFIVHQNMTVSDFNELYKWISARDIIATISIFTPMQGSKDFIRYEKELLNKAPEKQDLFHCVIKPKHMSLTRFYFEYYKIMLRLYWRSRKAPLYTCVNIKSFLFAIKATMLKIFRIFLA